MSRRAIGTWLLVAGVLLGIILLRRLLPNEQSSGPTLLLPSLNLRSVTSVQVRPPGTNQLEVRAERNGNQGWTLTRPFACRAQSVNVERLLEYLHGLVPTTLITAAELRSRPQADEEYGFSSPSAASIVVSQGDYRAHLRIGFTTLPGDQVFVQVVGIEGAYVVDSELLKLIPSSANAWRDRTFVDLGGVQPDRVAVTNGSRFFELHRESPSVLWRMVRPLQTRANHARIEDALESLQNLTVQQFVSDDTNVDAEVYGLQPPLLELGLSRSTNTIAVLQFGGSPTNDPEQVFARISGQGSIVTLPKSNVILWRASLHDFRDPYLVSLTGEVDKIEVRGESEFMLDRAADKKWKILPHGWPADPELVDELLVTLSRLPIAQFVKDVVMETDLPGYGLAPPSRQFVLKSRPPRSTNELVLVDLMFGFGTNREERVYARRTDESFVYAVTTNDFARLPSAGWQLRSRRLWNFNETQVAGLTVQQQDRLRRLIRKGPDDWSLAPGSQGVINDLAVEQTVRALAKVSAGPWVAHGTYDSAAYGLTDGAHQVMFELKDGTKYTVKFGKEAPSGAQYASITLDDSPWVFEFPWLVYRDVASYLVAP